MTTAAFLHAFAAALALALQLALALGAPIGHMAMGGRYPGRFPPRQRVLALFFGAIIIASAIVVLGRAGVIQPLLPGWLIWPVAALWALSTLGNVATASRPERAFGAPVATTLLLTTIWVIFAT